MAHEQGWITLAEYSTKYKVSISTLRRRIKNEEIEYSLNDGKYLLKDEPTAVPVIVPHLLAVSEARVVAPPPRVSHSSSEEKKSAERQAAGASSKMEGKSEANLDVQLLLAEIKGAFSLVLQEKEEHIIMLREEISDLRTFVKALEQSNSQLQAKVESLATHDWNDVASPDIEV